MKTRTKHLTRRTFFATSSRVLGSMALIPTSVWGPNPPSNRLNIGLIGCGGRGRKNLDALRHENIVALCDVDEERAAETFREYPEVPRFKDFRKMLDKMHGPLDAVVVSTPDHTHGVAAMAAIERRKHVYCEKPLAHSIAEVRRLTAAARQYRVQTQMGNQGHSSDRIRSVCEWVWDGALGPVREVRAWTNRLFDYRFPLNTLSPEKGQPVASSLDWDIWLGPRTKRPFDDLYMRWRAWMDFGTGALGDMGCHLLDPSFWALKLGEASRIEVMATTTSQRGETLAHTFPVASLVRYRFPARGQMPELKLSWYDGGLRPEAPEHLGPRTPLEEQGVFIVGDRASILHGSHGAGKATIVPVTRAEEYQNRLPDPTIPRVEGHHEDWVRACKTGQPASANFEYGGPLTEMVLLGVAAIRFQNERLLYDVDKMQIVNHKEANQFIRPRFREGWTL